MTDIQASGLWLVARSRPHPVEIKTMNQANSNAYPSFTSQKHGWIWLLFSGVLSVVLGVLLVMWPFLMMEVYGRVAGAFMMIAGIFGLFAVCSTAGSRRSVWMWMLPIMGGLLGALLFFQPVLALESIMLVLGAFAIFSGVYGLVATIAAWEYVMHHWLAMVFCVLTILCGVCMAVYPDIAIWVFGIWFGVSYLFNGTYQLFCVPDLRRVEGLATA